MSQEVKTKKRLTPYQTQKEMIEEVIRNFDFKKCQRVMKFLNWSWALTGIPNEVEMERTARHLMECAIDGCLKQKRNYNEPYFCATGGFKASVYRNVYGHINFVGLKFVLTEWDVDGDYFSTSD